MEKIKKIVKKVFQYEAKLILKKYKPKIIGITGSVGKTVSREAIYLVLSKHFHVRKTEKSFTTELGIPFTIIGCPDGRITPFQVLENFIIGLKLLFGNHKYPEWLILEMDGDKPGDLKTISELLTVDILVMTAIGEVPSHVESFYDLDNFLVEKKYIINAVKRDGVIVYNSDDAQTSRLVENTDFRKISCSIDKESMIRGTKFEILYGNIKTFTFPTGMKFTVKIVDEDFQINVFDSIGIHNEYACLVGASVGYELGIHINDIGICLSKYKSLPGRMSIISGIKDTLIIDDSYNSSPVALSQAVSSFAEIQSKGKKIAVLGDMLELGKYSADEHKKIAESVKRIFSKVVCVGVRMRKLSEELLNIGYNEMNIITVDNSVEAGKELQQILETGDVVLVKGSQAIRMEKVVLEVMRYPEDKDKLLVRQDNDWKDRD